MRSLFALCLFALAASHPITIFPALRMTPDEEGCQEVVKGIMKGMAADTNYSNLDTCFNDIVAIGLDVEGVVANLAKGGEWGLYRAAEDIADILLKLINAIQECNVVAPRDEIRLKDAVYALKHPFSVNPVKLIINEVDVSRELRNLQSSWQSQSWEMSGFYIGEMSGRLCGSNK